MAKIKVVQYGLGPIGLATARLAQKKDSLELVGAIDIDPAKVGKDLGDLLGTGLCGIAVSDDADAVLAKAAGGCALLTTTSTLAGVAPQLERCMAAGVNVTSSTEEMLVPDLRDVELCKALDEKARAAGVTVLGTGVNPGFVMDSLPVMLSSVCESVESVAVERFVDAATRREPLQRKVGASMTLDHFNGLRAEGKIGHVGLKESIAFLARGFGWQLDDVTEDLQAMVAEQTYTTDYLTVEPGQVTGIRNTGQGLTGGKAVISLDLRMYVGCQNPHDEIRIKGSPPLTVRVLQGTAGDVATVAAVVNSIPRAVLAPPGMKTIMDLALPGLVR